MFIQIVRFKSGLPDEEVLKKYHSRLARYQSVPGLVEKYYLRYTASREHGAVYVWEDEAALARFGESDLGRTIGTTYQIKEPAHVRLGEVVLTLHDEQAAGTRSLTDSA